jgi:hypothetical protein
LSSGTELGGILGTVQLAVFAFIGFEGLANVAQKVRRTAAYSAACDIPLLAISTILYVLALWVSLINRPDPRSCGLQYTNRVGVRAPDWCLTPHHELRRHPIGSHPASCWS